MRWTDAIESKMGWIAWPGVAILLILNAYEYGQDTGYRKAVAAMKCETNSGYSIIDTRTGKCAVIRGKRNG